MANTTATSPGTMANDSAVGTVAWSNVDNAKVSDNSYASRDFSFSATSNYLKATNFGFNIPTGATIDGILVEIEKRIFGDGDVVSDNIVSIVKANGSVGSTNKAIAGNWTLIEAYSSYGGATDKWSETLTEADINDSDFGVVLSVNGDEDDRGFNSTARVDHIRITVYYTEAVATITGVSTMQGVQTITL